MLMAQEALAFLMAQGAMLAAQERRVPRAAEVPGAQGQQGPRGREEAPRGVRMAVPLVRRMEGAPAGPGGRTAACFSCTSRCLSRRPWKRSWSAGSCPGMPHRSPDQGRF
uniref:Uncharacterized protein n=1 Tax=Pan troglodytes TaxID=9598 RepID=A0A2I3SI63_PANTR